MRSKVTQRILDNTPQDVEIFARLCNDIAVRIHAPKVMRAYAKHIIESLTDEQILNMSNQYKYLLNKIYVIERAKWARNELLKRLNQRQ